MSGDFLARWSRRKRAADTKPEAPEDRAPPTAPDDPIKTAEVIDEPGFQLPSPEELTAQSDVTAFLRKGVPEKLRNAVLRRMWSLDPAIRDYVGDARDYAWDWNEPGGVPGTGPLSVSEASRAVSDMWRSMGGEPSAAEPDAIDGSGRDDRGETGSQQSSSAGAGAAAGVDPDRNAPETPLLASAPPAPVRPPEDSPPADSHEASTPPSRPVAEPRCPPLRRHGRARPV